VNLPIATDSLVLRSFRDSDLDQFLAYRNDMDVARYQSWDGITSDEALRFLRSHSKPPNDTPGKWCQIAITLTPGDQLIGDIGIFLHDDRSAELGFTLAGEHQGRGFAHEAVSAVVAALFDQLRLEHIEAVTDMRNTRAKALLTRLGFELDSAAPATFKGVECQEETYTLSRRGWPP
jgi:RimJ/RimL family protein N-acetyltransferase